MHKADHLHSVGVEADVAVLCVVTLACVGPWVIGAWVIGESVIPEHWPIGKENHDHKVFL